MEDQKAKKGKWLRAEHIVSSSICPPAVRTVILMVHYHEEDTPPAFRHIEPVLAIESRIVETYSKHTYDMKKYAPIASCKKELLDEGYSFYGREREILLVHNNRDFGLDSTMDGEPSENGQSRIVMCMWPHEQDEKMFEPFFKDMEDSLKAQAAVKSPALEK